MQLEEHITWPDYELIDSGGFEKLERFGTYLLIRPEPQAIWPAKLSPAEWKHMAHARFDREQKDKFRMSDDIAGGWTKLKSMPDQWKITVDIGELHFKLRLGLTGFGHTGIFPEQSGNWHWLFNRMHKQPIKRVLNLFAYTGAASVVCRASGAEVTHVDGARPSLNWANENQAINNLADIRWVFEDAFRFVQRETRRGSKYNGILLDPPPYGRGAKGEKWVLNEQLSDLFEACTKLLEEDNHFLILSTYATSLSSQTGAILTSTFLPHSKVEYGEFQLRASRGNSLPMGTFTRVSSL